MPQTSSPNSKSKFIKDFKLGIYEHYKGQRYLAISLARLEADLTPVVVYTTLYSMPESPSQVWVRALDDFCSEIEHEGQTVQRFTYIGQAIN